MCETLFGSDGGMQTQKETLASQFPGQEALRSALEGYSTGLLNNAGNTYNTGLGYMNNAQGTLSNALNGNLPSTYTDNFNKTLSNSMSASLGSAANKLASKGILNSGTMRGVSSELGTSAANAAASNFNNAISQQMQGASLMGNLGNTLANQGLNASQPAQNMWSNLFRGQVGLSSPAQSYYQQGDSGLLGGLAGAYAQGLGYGWGAG
jgi:hypothetical protein